MTETVVLRHPTERLEIVVPRGRLAAFLLTLGYSEVDAESIHPDTALLSTDLERQSDDQQDQQDNPSVS